MPLEPNPFNFGDLAVDAGFADREQELAELTADLANGQNVVVFAPRRYGKSSLVWRATQDVVSRNRVLVAQVDLMLTATKEQLAAALAKAIYEDIATPLFRVRERVGHIVSGLRIAPIVTVDPQTGELGFSFRAGHERADVDATLEGLFELPAKLAAERRRRVAIVFDEFQEIVDIDPDLPRLMRSVFETQPDVAHVYLGSKRHMLARIFNDENEPFWRSAKQMELGVIPPPLFRDYIAEQFERTGRKVASAVVERVLETTLGHPYATQELCYFLWAETPARRTAREAEYEVALEKLLRAEHAHFGLVWEQASRAQRIVLQSLAREPGRPLTGDYRRRHGLPGPSSVQRALDQLVKDELVARDAVGDFGITEPFLGEWLRREEQ